MTIPVLPQESFSSSTPYCRFRHGKRGSGLDRLKDLAILRVSSGRGNPPQKKMKGLRLSGKK